MDRAQVAKQILRIARGLVAEENEYQKYFKKKLKEYGADDPGDLSDEKRAKFFKDVDDGWTAESEKK